MSEKNIILKLQELSLNEKKRSIAARLRDLYEAIEATLKNGISKAEIIKELNANGFEIKPSSFNTTLARIRKKQLKKATTPINKEMLQTPVKEKLPPKHEPQLIGSHDPKDLDAIFQNKPDLEALSKFAKRNRK